MMLILSFLNAVIIYVAGDTTALVLGLSPNTQYEFRIRPLLVTAATGEVIEEGGVGQTHNIFTSCTGSAGLFQ